MKKLILMVFLLGSTYLSAQIEIILDVNHKIDMCFINEVADNEYRPLNEKEFIVEGSTITMYIKEYASYEIFFFTKKQVDCILLRPMDFDIRDVRDLEITTNSGKVDVRFVKGVLVFDY